MTLPKDPKKRADYLYNLREGAKDIDRRGENNPEWKGGFYGTGKTKDEVYEELFEKQNGVCAICGERKLQKNQHGPCKLCIDHDHQTNKVRGLLCTRCNVKLGIIEDVEFVSKANLYLKNKIRNEIVV